MDKKTSWISTNYTASFLLLLQASTGMAVCLTHFVSCVFLSARFNQEFNNGGVTIDWGIDQCGVAILRHTEESSRKGMKFQEYDMSTIDRSQWKRAATW